VEKENPTVEKPSFSVPREKHLVFSTPAVEAQSLLPPRLFSFFHSFCILVLLFLKLTLFFLQREEKPTHNEREEETSMMKFSCEKALLQNAVGIASRTVAQKSSIPALEGLLLQTASALTISGYNMQTGIRTHVSADVTEQGEIVLNARLFGDIIRRMPDDVIVFSADDKQMVRLSCGDADFEILGLSAADYPELPEVEDTFSFSIQQKVLRDMIEQTAFAVSTNESRPVHTGALFEVSDQELAMVAVDGFRLAVRREALEKVEGGAFSFVAPGSALNEVEKICGESEDPARVTLGKRHVLFEVGDSALICRRLEGEFLDYKNAIPRKNPLSVVADTKSLIESIDRVSVVISDKLKSPVRCVFDHDKVLLSAKTGNGEAKDVCRLSGDGGGLEIGFNNRYFMEALRYAPADTVKIELNTGVSPAIIVPVDGKENFLYMVLPVRLKAAEGV
jgi:DNA polymerase-3 subunit beta